MEARISSALLHRITALAAADPAQEVCGLLLSPPLPVRPERSRGTCPGRTPLVARPSTEPVLGFGEAEARGLGTNGDGAWITDILPALNIHPEPTRHFELDPATHFAALRAARAGGPAILGHYHSHPNGRAKPSATDAAQALETGQLWLIVAGCEARLWQVSRPGTFSAVPLRITDGGGCASPGESPQEPTAARARDKGKQ